MRRLGIIMTAGAALALALVVPTAASATGKSTTQQSAEISAQGIGLDDEVTAQGKKGGKHGKYGKGDRHGRHGKGDGYRHGRSRHGHHHRYGHHHRGHRYYYGDRYYYGHPYYGGGYYRGGYGCNYDYPCGGQTYDCTRYRGPDGQPAGDPHCRYHTSDRTPEGSQTQPAPDQSGQPAPADQNAQPAPGSQPAPEGQPAPDQGQAPSDQPY
jgi:hypothetical protein